MNELLIITALLTKHFICDFPLQTKYQYENKGEYGHLGGILHACIHLIGTLLVMSIFFPIKIALLCAVIDGIVHYHIDWIKVNLNRRFDLNPYNGQWFWFLFGLDQFLHQITYVLLILLAVACS